MAQDFFFIFENKRIFCKHIQLGWRNTDNNLFSYSPILQVINWTRILFNKYRTIKQKLTLLAIFSTNTTCTIYYHTVIITLPWHPYRSNQIVIFAHTNARALNVTDVTAWVLKAAAATGERMRAGWDPHFEDERIDQIVMLLHISCRSIPINHFRIPLQVPGSRAGHVMSIERRRARVSENTIIRLAAVRCPPSIYLSHSVYALDGGRPSFGEMMNGFPWVLFILEQCTTSTCIPFRKLLIRCSVCLQWC